MCLYFNKRRQETSFAIYILFKDVLDILYLKNKVKNKFQLIKNYIPIYLIVLLPRINITCEYFIRYTYLKSMCIHNQDLNAKNIVTL